MSKQTIRDRSPQLNEVMRSIEEYRTASSGTASAKFRERLNERMVQDQQLLNRMAQPGEEQP